MHARKLSSHVRSARVLCPDAVLSDFVNRTVMIVVGLAIAAFGVYLSLFPLVTAEVLSRPHGEPTQLINLRASFGGTMLGIGLFVAWLPAIKPWKRTFVGLLMWAMAGIGAARLLGFALDGSPDSRQWIWIIAEVLIVVTGVILLRRWRVRAP
jgi:Domain of unknown function (DUF4345)